MVLQISILKKIDSKNQNIFSAYQYYQMQYSKRLRRPACANIRCSNEICRKRPNQDYLAMTCSCPVDPLICGNCIKITGLGETLKCKWCEKYGKCYIMHYTVKYHEYPFQMTIHNYESWENMIYRVNSYFFDYIFTPHCQIVRMANHWGEFLKVNRLQPEKMLQILSGNDILRATSDFFFVELLYVTQTLPRNPSFFSNCGLVPVSQFEIKQHVAINKSYFLLLKRITLSKILICRLFGIFRERHKYQHLIHMYMMSNIQFWHQVAQIFRRI